MEQIRRIMRPTDVPDQGLLCDLLWSDPDKDVLGWGENDRGVSFTFGSEVVAKFLHKHDLDLICRAHQVITVTSVITNRNVTWLLVDLSLDMLIRLIQGLQDITHCAENWRTHTVYTGQWFPTSLACDPSKYYLCITCDPRSLVAYA